MLVFDREEPDVTIENINPLDLVTYRRLQGQCEETVMNNGVDNSRTRVAEYRDRPSIPNAVSDRDNQDPENSSQMSELTTGTGKKSTVTSHTIRSDGSVGTSKSRVNTALDKNNSQWDKH